MRYLIILVCLLWAVGYANAAFITNPYTGNPDYYTSGLTVPQAYQETPTADTLRDALIAAGIMSAAPAAVVPNAMAWQDDPAVKVVFQDDPVVKVAWQDSPD